VLLVPKNRRLTLLIGGSFFTLLGLWWLFTHRIDRFWLPAMPFWALLAGVGGTWSKANWWRWTLAGFLVLGLTTNFFLIVSPYRVDNRYFVSLLELRYDKPTQTGQVSRVSPVHRYLNEHAQPDWKVLLVGDAQAFDLEVPTVYNTCFDDCIFEQWMKGRSKEERLALLREQKITHVYISWSEIERYKSPGNYGFTDYVTPQLVHGELIQQQGILRRVKVDQEKAGELFEVVK